MSGTGWKNYYYSKKHAEIWKTYCEILFNNSNKKSINQNLPTEKELDILRSEIIAVSWKEIIVASWIVATAEK